MEFSQQEINELNLHGAVSYYSVRPQKKEEEKAINNAAPVHVVIRAACWATGISEAMLFSKIRKRELVTSRILISVYLYANTNKSRADIAFIHGLEEPTSIINHERRFISLVDERVNDVFMIKARDKFLDFIKKNNPAFSLSMDTSHRLNSEQNLKMLHELKKQNKI